MIHDATAEVTCDGFGCSDSVHVSLGYVYGGLMHTDGRYDDDDEEIERRLVRKHEWIVADGNHYCSEHCQPKKKRAKA